jgi:hypothetical protein
MCKYTIIDVEETILIDTFAYNNRLKKLLVSFDRLTTLILAENIQTEKYS